MPDTFPFFPLHPNPCNLLALQQLHRSHTARPRSSRETTAQGSKHLGETAASSPQRSPPPAQAMASAPDSVISVLSSLKQSRGIAVLLCSDQRCLFHPSPWPTHTTEHFGASLRDCILRIWADQTHRMHNASDSHVLIMCL